MDYYFWSVLKDTVYDKKTKDIPGTVKYIAVNTNLLATLQLVCCSILNRYGRCITVNGGHFVHL